MKKLIFALVCLPIFVFAQVMTPYQMPHPQLEDQAMDEYFSFQWGLANYGQAVFEQLGPLEYQPKCGASFTTKVFDPEGVSADDFFLNRPDRTCTLKTENSDRPIDHDADWVQFYSHLEKKIQRDVVVAILDLGTDYTHPDLQGNFAKNLSQCNEDGLPGLPPKKKKERSKEKKIRKRGLPAISEFDFSADCLGWNFTDPKNRLGNNRPFDSDSDSHGTHLSGIVSAVRGNGLGVAGLSNRIKVLPVKVLGNIGRKEIDRVGLEKTIEKVLGQITLGLEYVGTIKRYGRAVDAVNMSFGLPMRLATPRLKKALQNVIDQGTVVVAAAGNEDVNVDLFPCAYPGVICVGAHNHQGQLAGFSNYGSSVDLTAPGESILSLSRTDEVSKLFSQSDEYDYITGTSQAAPFVAGASALLKGIFPAVSTDEVQARLFASARDHEATDHRFTQSGMLQIAKSIQLKPRPYLRPELKTLTQILVSSNDLKINLPIKSFWQRATNIRVDIKSLSANVVLSTRTIKIKKLGSSTTALLPVSAKILDLNKSSRASFVIDISYSDASEQRKFIDSFNLTTELYIQLKNSNYTDYPLKLNSETLVSINEVFDNNQGKLNIGRILTKKITPSDLTDSSTEYFVDSLTKKDGVSGVELSVVTQEGGKFVQKPIAFLSKTLRFQVNKLDIIPESPGSEFIVRSVGFDGVNDGKLKGFFIEYYIIDENYQPLFTSLKLRPLQDLPGRNLNSDPDENFRFEVSVSEGADNLNSALAQNPKTLVSEKSSFNKVFFIQYGQLSDEDNSFSLDNFEIDELNAKQIYYLDKIPGANELKLRTFSSPQVRQNIKKSFVSDLYERGIIDSPRIHPDMSMEFWHLFNQNDIKNEIKVLASFSMQSKVKERGQELTSWQASLNTNHFFTITIKQNLEGEFVYTTAPFETDGGAGLSFNPTRDSILTYFAINKLLKGDYLSIKNDKFSQAQISYQGLRSKSYLSSPKQLEVRQASQPEALLNDLISYRNGERYYSFFKTVGEILMTTSEGEQVSVSTHELKVSDFISQFSFKELMVPSLYSDQEKLLPSLFINASEIHSRRVYSWVIEDGSRQLIAPIHLNIEVSDNCLPLAPSKVNGAAPMNYTFLCRNKKQEWFFRFVPIKKSLTALHR